MKLTDEDLDNLWGYDEIQNMLVEELKEARSMIKKLTAAIDAAVDALIVLSKKKK